MRRCAICDYLEGFGSDSLGIPNNHQSVKWRHKHQEFQCQACYNEIQSVKKDYAQEDINALLELMTEEERKKAWNDPKFKRYILPHDDEMALAPPTLSEVLVK